MLGSYVEVELKLPAQSIALAYALRKSQLAFVAPWYAGKDTANAHAQAKTTNLPPPRRGFQTFDSYDIHFKPPCSNIATYGRFEL